MIIPLPLGGLNDSLGFSAQPPTTSSDIVNCRSIDKLTGRARFAQRSGIGSYTRNPEAVSAVTYMNQVTFDGRKMTYAGSSTGARVWSFITPSAVESRYGVLDRQGNVYALDGLASIVKINPSGEKVWVLAPPVKDRRHLIRAVYVDAADNVYVGVSDGGAQSLGRLWRFSQRRGEQPKQEWEVELDSFVTQIVVRGDLVYTAQNQPDRWGAGVVVYRGGLSSKPSLAWAATAAYPLNGILLKADNSVVGWSPPFTSRGLDPRYPAFTESTIDATLRDILGAGYDRMVWRDNDASDLEQLVNTIGKAQQEGDESIRDGDPIELWPDVSGNDRDLFLNVAIAAQTAPRYNARGIAGLPSIYFRGTAAVPVIADSLQTIGSASASQVYSDQYQGLVPGYQGAKWVMFVVMRPEEDRAAAPAIRAVLGQPSAIGGVAATDALFSNRQAGGGVAAGLASWVETTAAGGVGIGTGANPQHFQYSEAPGITNQPHTGNPTGAGVLTILFDGGANPGADNATTPHSLLRWNGLPIDRWLSRNDNQTIDPSFVGISQLAGTPNFRGDIARIIVIRDNAVATDGLLSHPHYPHNIHTAAVAPAANISTGSNPFLATQMEQIEGMLMHKYRMSHLLPDPAAGYIAPLYGAAPFSITNNYNYPHPFWRRQGPPRASQTAVRSEPYMLHSPNGLLAKWAGATGDLQWVVTATSAVNGGGLGYGAAVDTDGNLFSVGPKITAGGTFVDNYTADDTNIRKVQDLDAKGIAGFSTFVGAGGVAWQNTLGTVADDWSVTKLDVASDEYGNLFVPMNYAAIGPFTLKVYANAASFNGSINVGNEILSYTDVTNAQAYAVALAPTPDYRFGPTYDFDRNPATDNRTARTEFAYLFLQQVNTLPNRDPGLIKVSAVTATPITGSPRQSILVQVNAGNVDRFTRAGVADFVGASTLTKPQLSATSEYTDGAISSGKLYLTDGISYVFVDARDDAVRSWKAVDGGVIPPRCKLICNWRNRIVLARAPDDPHNWHMSELGNPRGWDRFGVPLLSTRAVSGNNARAGLCPDIINALIPYDDQTLIMGCDHSLWALIGDPANEGASAGMRLVSDITGVAFGRSWAKSPEGVLYFFGSRGGIYRMVPGRQPENMTLETIDRRLTEIDLSVYRIELVWNTDDDGLHVFLIPTTEQEETVHYFWCRSTDGWFSDIYAFPPTSVFVADGDLPDDRLLLLGGFDGQVRQWDRDVKSDDGTAFEVRALIGPLAPEESETEWRFRDLEAVLARDQDAVQVTLYASSVPDKKGSALTSLQLEPGRNPVRPIAMVAPYCWVEISQKNANRTWAIESLAWRSVLPGGTKRLNV